MGRGDLGTLVRICDPAGRPRGTGFVADDRGTVVTSHEAVDGLVRIVLRAPGDRTYAAEADAVTAPPGTGLALVRTEGLDVRPMPVSGRTEVEAGTYVRIAAHGWREARVLGAAAVSHAGAGRRRVLGHAWELAIGTEGADALRLGGQATGGPVVDPETGAVLAVLATALHGDHRAAGYALPLAPVGPLAELLRRNAATAPCYGPELNLAAVLELTATSTGAVDPAGTRTATAPVERGDCVREFTAFAASDALVLALVGAPGSGRTTALAAHRAERARGAEPAPTVWLRGGDLRADDTSVADAAARVLRQAGRVVTASGARGDTTAATPEHAAALARAAGRPLLIVLDGPEEMPPALAHRLPAWTTGTENWLRAHGARLMLGCRPEHWEQAFRHYTPESLHRPGVTPGAGAVPGAVPLGDLTEEEARLARARYGLDLTDLAADDARHPLTLRLLAEVRDAVPGGAPGRPGREEILGAHLDLMCLRVAVRIAAGTRPVPRGADVRRLATRVAGQVHEAARRCLGPGQGELDRGSFEELFPWRTGWASAVLTEGLVVPAGSGYRLGHEELADWIQGAHLDVDEALRTLAGVTTPGPAWRGVSAEVPARPPAPAQPGVTSPGPAWRGVSAEVPARPPAPAQPGVTSPGPARRGASAEVPADPEATSPAPAWPGVTLPPPVRSRATTPAPAQSGTAASGPSWPGVATPGQARPEATTPGPAGPGATTLAPAQQWTTTPAPAPPGTLTPGPARPGSTPTPAPPGTLTPGPAEPGASPAVSVQQPLPVPRHRIGPVVQALLLMDREHGSDALGLRLSGLAEALNRLRAEGLATTDAGWWASRLLAQTLLRLQNTRPYLPVLRRLADHLGGPRPAPPAGEGTPQPRPAPETGPAAPLSAPAAAPVFGPAFWQALRIGEGERIDLLRRLVPADPPVGATTAPRFLDVVAARLVAEPRGVQPLLCRWFGDGRALAAAPYATVGTAAQALLHTHRHLAVDDLCEALVATTHPLADGLLTALTEDEPSAVCRAVDRWAHDDGRPARRAAAATYGSLVAPHATTGPDRELLRYAALALLARPGDADLHGPALGLLVRDPHTRSRHLPRALTHPRVPADALTAALATHPEPVLAALQARLHGPGEAAGETLRALAEVSTPTLARRAAALVGAYVDRHPDGAHHAAAFVDRRLEHGPAARAVLFPLVTGLLRGRPVQVRSALARVLAAPGTGASRLLRTELLDVLLDHERYAARDLAVLDALLRAAALGCERRPEVRTRDLVHRSALLLVRTPEGATCCDRRLVELAREVPAFATQLARWLADAPDEWAVVVGPGARRTVQSIGRSMPMRGEGRGHGSLRPA
ncbi:trypsin-like peptidase domain-containing protein [Streptomyces sp. NPDC046332]|uniref:trypsin-like peptidase domain-containing protein n=1 Tax=Streptomyces sp. NPDC046332 TaxID=3155133 RepID=UPI0033F1BD5A